MITALTWLAFGWIFNRDRSDCAQPVLDELRRTAADNPYWLAWHGLVVGMAAWREGRLGEARQALEAAFAVSRQYADPELESYVVEFLANVQIGQGDYEGAGALVGQSVERLRRSAACRQEWVELRLAAVAVAEADLSDARRQLEALAPAVEAYGIPCLTVDHDVLLGRIALEEANLAAAGSAFQDASAIAVRLEGPWTLVETHNYRGRLARAGGDLAPAEDLHHQALALALQHGLRGAAAETLEQLAAVAVAGESHAEAARLFGATQALQRSTGQHRWLLDQPAYDADLEEVRGHLGDGFEQAWKEGEALTLEEAAAYASRARGERKRPATGWASLTPTELEVVALAAQGLTNAEIGTRLFISATTAKTHLAHIYAKLGVANRAALAAQAAARAVRSD